VLRQALGRELTRGREHREGDRQVEAGALLAERCRRQVHGDPAVDGPFERGRDDPAPHPVLRLLTRAVREADDRERRLLPGAQMSLDLDAAGLEADERERDRAAQHASTLRGGS
jgi:hypothetical protein